MADATWVATLSDGTTAVEETGRWKTIPGERKPWVRLADFAHQKGLYLTSLRVNFDGRTIHLPREKFGRFGLEDHVLAPRYYSLEYCVEAEMNEQGSFGDEKLFIKLAAHFEDELAVNLVQQLNDQDISWIVLTKGGSRMATTPPSPVKADA